MPRERREQLILDVAGQVFARRRLHSASMDEIADSPACPSRCCTPTSVQRKGCTSPISGGPGVSCSSDSWRRDRDPSPGARLRARITEFLAFVEEHRNGWKVLFGEVGSSRPFAENVAAVREQIAEAIRVMIEGGTSSRCGYARPAADAIAHALVGAGESLANWWLDHPEVTRDEVADWYYGVVQAVLAAPEPRS